MFFNYIRYSLCRVCRNNCLTPLAAQRPVAVFQRKQPTEISNVRLVQTIRRILVSDSGPLAPKALVSALRHLATWEALLETSLRIQHGLKSKNYSELVR